MILNVVVPTTVLLLLLAVLVTVSVINTVWGLKNTDIENQMESVANQVTQYFAPYFVSEEFVADRTSIKDIFAELERGTAAYRFEESDLYETTLRDLQYADSVGGEAVQSVWIAGVKNSQIIQSDGFISDDTFDIQQRVWYQLLEQNPGVSILTPAYEDVSTGNLIVTAAMPYTDASGTMLGVIGIDLALDNLMEFFSQITIGESGYITVYDSDQNIIYHPDSSVLMRNLQDVEYSDNMRQLLENRVSSDVVNYQRGGQNFYGGTRFIDLYHWTVLACMPGSEYMQETTFIFIILVLGFVLCIIMTALICLFRTKALIKPLQTIDRVAENVEKGKLDTEIRRSTNDEIGDLEDTFAAMQTNLKNIIADIAMVLKGISNKDLTVKTTASYQGDFVAIRDSLQWITIAMNDTMSRVREAAAQVDAGSTQVSNGAQALAQGTTEQASSVEELSATAEESAASSEELSGQASILESLIAQFKLARELYEPSEPAVASESPAEPSSMYEKY